MIDSKQDDSDSNLLRMSECTTPDVLSVNDEEGREDDDGEFPQPKAWKDLIVRKNKNPET